MSSFFDNEEELMIQNLDSDSKPILLVIGDVNSEEYKEATSKYKDVEHVEIVPLSSLLYFIDDNPEVLLTHHVYFVCDGVPFDVLNGVDIVSSSFLLAIITNTELLVHTDFTFNAVQSVNILRDKGFFASLYCDEYDFDYIRLSNVVQFSDEDYIVPAAESNGNERLVLESGGLLTII